MRFEKKEPNALVCSELRESLLKSGVLAEVDTQVQITQAINEPKGVREMENFLTGENSVFVMSPRFLLQGNHVRLFQYKLHPALSTVVIAWSPCDARSRKTLPPFAFYPKWLYISLKVNNECKT